MTRRSIALIGIVLLTIVLAPNAVSAQLVVYDPTNYAQAVSRYLDPEVRWRTHDDATAFPYARPVLNGLNYGDATGSLYLQGVDRLESLDGVIGGLPASLRRRLGAQYGTIEMADSVAAMGIHQAGAIRFNGRAMLRAIESMEQDLVAAPEEFHTQAALLNKINGATVLGLRIAENSSQFLMHTLEQLLVENKRKRDAEAQAMNAHIYHWRYGRSYAADLFQNTARNIDGWRQP